MAPKPKAADVIAAATECDVKQLSAALDAGGPIHAVGKGGNSALHCAAAKGDTAAAIATIKLLLERGADVSSENDLGDNALAFCQSKKYNKLAALLEDATAAAVAAEAERRKAKAAAKAKEKAAKEKAARAAAGEPEPDASTAGEAMPYRRAGVGWKPLLKDWMAYVKQWKHLTDDLTGRKVAISFSNKSVDSAFARELEKELKGVGALPRQLVKFPVSQWVHACVFAADEADFVIVLHSQNYEDGNYSSAERLLVKESNVPHLVLEIDSPSHAEYVANAADALAYVKANLVLSQKARVETNTMACTWTLSTLTGEARAAYEKITKVWTKKEASADPLMIDLERLADEQAAEAKKAVAAKRAKEADEVEELTKMLASGASSRRSDRPVVSLD